LALAQHHTIHSQMPSSLKLDDTSIDALVQC